MKYQVAFVLILLAACAPKMPIEKNETQEKITGATFGDLVSINFVLSLENGTIVDTNNPELAQKYGITNYVKGPFSFILGQSGKVKGFDDALLGMKEGEHRETIIEPSEKEIILAINKTKTLNRILTINKKQGFPLKAFERHFGKPPKVNDIVKSDDFVFKYKVLNITEEGVITEMVLKEGESYVLPNTYWNSSVVRITENDAMFLQQPEENQIIEAPFGKAVINMTKSRIFLNFQPELHKVFNRSIELGGGFAIPQQFQVVEIKDDEFIIKRYGALEDKRLKIKIDLLKLTPGVKEVKQKIPYITEVQSKTEN
ncbi:MAG: FKBP-type peptidyl-prolyl cis-trans isomerase [Candidatus Woesearchaeota archaeon]